MVLMSLVTCGASAADSHAATSAGTPSQQATAKACHKQAAAKNLHGDERARFLRECKEGKPAS